MSDPSTVSDLDEKLSKCIRCGFCLDACPTFRLTGQETLSPRGRIYLVRSWRENEITFGDDVVHAIDTCLGCRACETACPSGVEYGMILEHARAHIQKAKLQPPLQRFARNQLLSTLTSPGKMAASLVAGGWLGKLTGGKMPGFASQLLSGDPEAELSLPKVEGEIHVDTLPELSPAKGEKRYTVGILAGCVMRVLFGETNRATVRVLQENGCDVLAPNAAGCCGALHIHAGHEEGAKSRIRTMIDAFSPILDTLDAIIINSAGCGSTMKEYKDFLASDPNYADKAAAFSAKCRDVSEFLESIEIAAPRNPLHAVVSYHDACHLAHGQGIRLQPRKLLQKIPGVTWVELDEADTCCGSAGTYNLTQPEMARRLLDRKLDRIEETGAEIIATGNPGCLAWIQQGAQERRLPLRIVHPIQLLDEAYRTGNKS